jgi:hypothetical protein
MVRFKSPRQTELLKHWESTPKKEQNAQGWGTEMPCRLITALLTFWVLSSYCNNTDVD